MLSVILLAMGCFCQSGEKAANVDQPPVVVEKPAWEGPPPDHRQVVLVQSPNWESMAATMSRLQWTQEQGWQEVGEQSPVVVGSAGLGWGVGLYDWPIQKGEPMKLEGDHRAPAGIFSLESSFGYAMPKGISWDIPYTLAHVRLHCVDDGDSKYYNQFVDEFQNLEKDWNSSEVMRREDNLYKWGLVIGHNPENDPGKGSCVFMHMWRSADQGTLVSTAMPERAITRVLPWLDPAQQPILVQVSGEGLPRLRAILADKRILLAE